MPALSDTRAPASPIRPPPERPSGRSAALSLEARRAFGGLLPLIDEPELRDILIQVSAGVGRLWVDAGGALQRVESWQVAPDTVRRLAVALIAAGGRHLDEMNPVANVRLGDGIRVHAVLPPVSAHGAAVSVRVPRLEPLSFDALVRGGLCSDAHDRWLRLAVCHRKNLLITGGTGSGKTTVLGALLDLAPAHERIVTIEDLVELRLRHPHHVSLEARQSNAEGVGEFSLERLLRESLRMRPDRLVLGECRGAEVATLLAALNTGHDGGAGTLHASRLADVPSRLEALGALASLSPESLARQAASALHAVVHVERCQEGTHRVAAIGRFVVREGLLTVVDISEPRSPGEADPPA
ncbi:CpaF family protein [Leucobacter sp. W1478]|uniref:CpaF family protein n=1 Tax=Leucobacter sp. W1478 TaxID=3439065 RepID=UPI003F351CB3